MKSGEEKFAEKYTDPEAAKRAVEAQKAAGERLIKARKARESSAETKPAANPANPEDLMADLEEIYRKKEEDGEGAGG